MEGIVNPFGFIYETTNQVNNMKYIGKCIYTRKNNWKVYMGSGLYLKRAIKKYGLENFTRVILAEANSAEELNALEEYYILLYKAVESPTYYNVKFTSIGGDIFTMNPNKESIRLQRVQQMSGEGNHQYGKAKSRKMIESVRKANSRVVMIDNVEYSSGKEAAEILNIKTTTLNYRLGSDHFPNYERLYEKVNRPTNKTSAYKCQIGNIQYESIAKAASAHGISTHSMRNRMYSKNFPDHFIIKE
ncbi:MAG: hypothetical protein WBF39_11535 [Planococcus donghaensis]